MIENLISEQDNKDLSVSETQICVFVFCTFSWFIISCYQVLLLSSSAYLKEALGLLFSLTWGTDSNILV